MKQSTGTENYLKERERDYDLVKRENSILKEENKILRGVMIQKLNQVEKDSLLQLVDLQRQRIDNLEREYDLLIEKYDKMASDLTSSSLASSSGGDL